MSNEDPNVTVARFSFKQAIIVALITGATTLGGTLLTLNKKSQPDSTPDNAVVESCLSENEDLKSKLDKAIPVSRLNTISSTYFTADASSNQAEASLINLINNLKGYEEEREHFTGKLFRLKKLMLLNGGNINVRVPSADKEACKLIQDLLQGIEHYRGSVDGNIESTREAVENFQHKLNQYTPDYFAEKNIGIVGKKTFNAILERYEKN